MSATASLLAHPRVGRAARAARLRPGAVPALVVVTCAVLAALWPDLLTDHSPDTTAPARALRPPDTEHLFGTDQLGRDVYARVVYGARLSLEIGVGATVIGSVVGTVIGLVAGLGGRAADAVSMRATDVLTAFPELLLALLVITVTGPGTTNVLVSIGVASVPGYARLVRSRALVVRRADFVEAGVALGVSRPALVLRHILPNTVGPLLVLASIGTGTAVVSGAALSYLGMGPRPPAAEWGVMLADGQDFVQTAWWITVFPGLAVAAVVMAVTVLGRTLRERGTEATR
ncbi:ABC transporter permease [Embleya hyalina]|uniref:ABC transporter permease n=1 Tax=Embleya hyalina TaxID=516124 RepID=A0A401Z1K0_9ACTN|nr:ABC transporter permease [Embleya hyalina]GCE00763.1 ABC transporter permease [Embleya hyalina]